MSNIQLLRHATIVVNIAGKKILVDPMLAPKDTFDPIPNAGNNIRIPMVELPLAQNQLTELLQHIDAVVVTHTHPDHWDTTAQELLPKDIPLFCQPVDHALIQSQGFTNVTAITDHYQWQGVDMYRTGGVHGKGEILKMLGEVSGFVFKHAEESIYVAGDTIWHPDVVAALDTHHPHMTILNAGGAQFVQGDPITMTPDEVAMVHAQAPYTQIVAIHMNTVNHCLVRRSDLKKAMDEQGIQVIIPADGETVELTSVATL